MEFNYRGYGVRLTFSDANNLMNQLNNASTPTSTSIRLFTIGRGRHVARDIYAAGTSHRWWLGMQIIAVAMKFAGPPLSDRTCDLQFPTNIAGGEWANLVSAISGNEMTNRLTDTIFNYIPEVLSARAVAVVLASSIRRP